MPIDLNPSSDQNQIIASMRKLLADVFPVSRLRGPQAARHDLPRLAALSEVGAFGLGTRSEDGGAGFSIAEEALLFTELGRHLVTPNALAATIGVRLAIALGMPQIAEDIIGGKAVVCIANALQPFALNDVAGIPAHLLDPEGATVALLWNDDGIALLRRDPLVSEPMHAMDHALTVHRCVLQQAAVLGWLPASDTPLIRQAHLLLSAMLLGMAEATRDMAVDYAKTRMQFGRPIGAFQAVKHSCANMAIAAEALQAQIAFAALAERDGWADAAFQVDAAWLLATRCALANASANVQVHGAIGFTTECDAHLYVLRAHLHENIGGPRGAVKARLARFRSTSVCV